MSIRKLIEFTEEKAKEELGEYYIVSKSRLDNIVCCVENGAKRISELTKIIEKQQEEIKTLQMTILGFQNER